VGDDRVLDDQFVQPEFRGERLELNLGRPVEADPGHAARRASELTEGIREVGQRLAPPAIEVDRSVDDAVLDRRVIAGRPGVHLALGGLVVMRLCGA
jgi:hypothetical protein